MKKTSKYKYSSAREVAEKMTQGFESQTLVLPEGVKQFRLKTDKSVKIDIIPFVTGKGNPNCDEGMLHWERTYYVHRGVGPNSEMVVCLARTFGKKCPVCQYLRDLSRDPDADEDQAKNLRDKRRQLFLVIDHSDREAGVQVWDISYHLFGKLLAKRISDGEDGEWDKFWYPDRGLTLKLGVEEKSFGDNTFFEVVSIDFLERKTQYKESIVEDSPCLDDIIKELSYDDLKEKLEMEGEESSDEDEDDEKPVKKKKKVEDDDEDSDDDDGEDDDSDTDGDDEDEDSDEDSDDDSDESDDDDADDSEDDDEDESDEDEDEDDEDEDDEDEDDEDEDEDNEEDEFEEELPPKKKKAEIR